MMICASWGHQTRKLQPSKWRGLCLDGLITSKWTGRVSQSAVIEQSSATQSLSSSAQLAGWSVASQLSPLELASTASLGINTQHALCHQPPTSPNINPVFSFTIPLFPRPSPRSLSPTPIRVHLLKCKQCAYLGPTCTSTSCIAGLSVLLTRLQSQPPFLDIITISLLLYLDFFLVHICVRFSSINQRDTDHQPELSLAFNAKKSS